MDIRIKPHKLGGVVEIPSSKSIAHRAVICAGLAERNSRIGNISTSKDIEATAESMSTLGASVNKSGCEFNISGIKNAPEKAVIDCNESGSTLRFLIPVVASLGVEAEFHGRGRLPQRPIDIYIRELGTKGINFNYNNTMPFDMSGSLKSGIFEVEGNISSQFITGLLMALPLLDGDSEIVLTSRLESRPYVDITIDVLRNFGICITETDRGFYVKGGQKYKPCDYTVEGDYSQGAFFLVANAIGSDVKIIGLSADSVQGDRRIAEIIKNSTVGGKITGFREDCSDIPDLVPILAVLASFGTEESVIYNAERLKIKESDRLESTAEMINRTGGSATVTADGLIIRPTGITHGAEIDSFGDHRIVMASAVLATRADGDIIIKNAEAVEKSYPCFFEDYRNSGGVADVISME
ncbi:MAG: 3-phosphoshikimate 1-carboxyvinyltransferase [Ruminococcus sp.]|nr:3-phosphoshikimate 1-carboxyvinyltransferase [Ruminococcus sp.]